MESFVHPISEQLRAVALALPETSEGSSCVNRAYRVRKKNFLFLGEKDGQIRIMVKLTASLGDAESMADPRVAVGTHGWVTLHLPPDDLLDADLLAAWVLESFRAIAPKALVKSLETAGR